MELELNILSFEMEVEELISTKKISHIEAILEWCEINAIDPEMAGHLVKKNSILKELVKAEAEDLHFLPRGSRLPI